MRCGLNFEININIKYTIYNHVLAFRILFSSLDFFFKIRKQYKNLTVSVFYMRARHHRRKTARLAGTDFTNFVVGRREHGGRDKLMYDD